MNTTDHNTPRPPRVTVVGIAGGIGSGKSVVSRVLRLRGECVYDCDTRAKALMDSSVEVLESLNRWCGDAVAHRERGICRAELASAMFADSGLRQRVNGLVHRLVREDFARYAAECPRPVVYVESAIMATSGLAAICDMVIEVTAPEALRIERAVARGGLTAEQARSRIEAQAAEREALATLGPKVVTVVNDGLTPLLPQLTALTRSLAVVG